MNTTLKKIIQLGIMTCVVLCGVVFASTDVYAGSITLTQDLRCSGSGYCGSPECSNVWTVSDNDYSYINSAWRGSYRQWDDVSANRASVNGVEELYERSDNLGIPGWNKARPDCGCGASGCPGSDNPLPDPFFQRLSENNVTLSMTVSAEEKFKTNGAPGSFAGTAAFGVSQTICDPGERNINGQCVTITGTLNVTPLTCTSPCDVTISWNTNSLNNARVVRNSSITVYSANAVPTGNTPDRNLSAGSYTYCLTGNDGFGNMTANLDCKTITVNNPVVTTSAPTCSPANPLAVIIGQPVILTGSGGDGTFAWTAQGGNPATVTDVGQTTSTFSPTFSTAGVRTVVVKDGLNRVSNPCNVTVINPTASPNVYLYISATPMSGTAGSASTLQWTVYNATSCYANGGWSGIKNANNGNNTETITINSTPTIYSITCTNANNASTVTDSVTVSPTTGGAVASRCGNNSIDAGEACDTGSARGACPSRCSTSCNLNSCVAPIGTPPLASGQSCGNGIREGSEQCDKGSANGTCAAGCTAPDANSSGCATTNTCYVPPGQSCGNRITEGSEWCDDGPANGNCTATVSPRCSTQCFFNSCNPPTVRITASPTVTPWQNGIGATTLSWQVSNAGRGCFAAASPPMTFSFAGSDTWHGPKNSSPTNGSGLIKYGNQDVTFSITCESWDGQTATDSVTVYRGQRPKPNLTVTNFSLTDVNGIVKTTFDVNEMVFPSVRVTNNGPIPITEPFVISFFKDRALPVNTGASNDIFAAVSGTINPGASRTYSVIGNNFNLWNPNTSVVYTSPGIYVARIFVDSGNSIDEIDESDADNQLTTIVTIVGAPIAPPRVTLTAPSSVVSGSGVPLSWSSTNTTGLPTPCIASASPSTPPWSGAQAGSGNTNTVPITGQTTFTLSCTNAGGTSSDSKTVNVTPPPPVITFDATPNSGVSPLTTTLTWFVANFVSCSGSVLVSPASTQVSPSWIGSKTESGLLDVIITSAAQSLVRFGLRCGGTFVFRDVTVFPPAPSASVSTNKTLTINTPINGKVTSTDTFIDCGVGANPARCSHTYSSVGCTTVTLQAVPSSSSWRFTGWGGSCSGTGNCNLNLCVDSSVSATFGRRPLNYEEF